MSVCMHVCYSDIDPDTGLAIGVSDPRKNGQAVSAAASSYQRSTSSGRRLRANN